MTAHLDGIGSPAKALSWIEGTRLSLDSLASLVCLSNSTELLAMILAHLVRLFGSDKRTGYVVSVARILMRTKPPDVYFSLAAAI
jgi:hypothetical protein